MTAETHSGEMMTVSQVAEYLNLNEKMIYRLVGEGRLPGTKVTGKWTFPRHLVRQWMEVNALKGFTLRPEGPALEEARDLFVAGSNDLVLDHIVSLLIKRGAPDEMAYFSNTGSLGGLRALAMGKAHLCGLHLYSPEDETYNTPFVKSLLPGRKTVLFNLAYREQGLIFRSREKERIQGVASLAGGTLRMVNREQGSGTRHLLDLHLKNAGLDGMKIPGYGREVSTHLEVGTAILREEADVGMGIEPVARLLGLEFLPLARERYDLAVPVEYISSSPVGNFISLLQSDEIKKEVGHLPGYDLSDMGRIIN